MIKTKFYKKIVRGIYLIVIITSGVIISTKASAQSYVLGLIDVGFCNNELTNNELDLVSKAGDKLPICIEFTNKSTSPITINVEFLDSIITSDNLKDRACNAADRPKTQFGNFILPYTGNLILPPQQTIQKNYTIRYPIGFKGLSHGCVAYNVVGADINNESMFTIRIRSIKYLDIFVADTTPTQVVEIIQTPRLEKQGDEYIISLGLQNKGNVDEKVQITSTIYNIFGYKKELSIDTILAANTGVTLSTPSFILPVYGGPFLVRSKIAYIPRFNFNITNGETPDHIYAGGTKKIQTLLFIWTRQSGIAILIIILFILGSIRISKKEKQAKKTSKK